eukprot:7764669-Pyramimonas_sp.AAC.1
MRSVGVVVSDDVCRICRARLYYWGCLVSSRVACEVTSPARIEGKVPSVSPVAPRKATPPRPPRDRGLDDPSQ